MQPARERVALSKHRLNNSIFMALIFRAEAPITSGSAN